MSQSNLPNIRPISIHARASKVRVAQCAPPPIALPGFLAQLPPVLAASGLRDIVDGVVAAHRNGRPVLVSMGAHPIKCGLAPTLVDLARRGVVTAFATNGATLIHDSELALFGHTSEDVEQGLRDGTFGMAEETAAFLNEAIAAGAKQHLGMGEAVGRALLAARAPHADCSLLAGCAALGIPLTVHVAVGTDVIHMHPSADGGAIGETSLRDFRRLVALVGELTGGALLNLGSAVILPEVLLKAFAILRNRGQDLAGCLSVDLDMIRSYRTTTQLVDRVRLLGGRGMALTGHHEIMVPLLAGLILAELDAGSAPDTLAGKLVARDKLPALGEQLRAAGRRVVFTNGCFDLLHVGHTRYLRQARALGDVLVVALNTDRGVSRLKGPTRPLIPETERAELLAELTCVDYVTLFDEPLPNDTILALRPHVHVKGGDYTADALPETPVVRSYGGEVRILPLTPDRSTTRLAEALSASAE